MRWLWDPELVLLRSPVPVTIGRGGLAPVLGFAALFALMSARAGLPIAIAVLFGAVGGTASLVAHELGHVRTASRLSGPRPVGVSLIWLGAATHLEGGYSSGRDQARVAIAGPIMSFAAALSLLPMLFLPIPVGLKGPLLMLVGLNVAIAVLSLIPAEPLDGYKLIVGLVWSALGSEPAARRLIRRLALSWAAVELVGTGVLLVEKPVLGATVVAIGASLFGQKLFARRSA